MRNILLDRTGSDNKPSGHHFCPNGEHRLAPPCPPPPIKGHVRSDKFCFVRDTKGSDQDRLRDRWGPVGTRTQSTSLAKELKNFKPLLQRTAPSTGPFGAGVVRRPGDGRLKPRSTNAPATKGQPKVRKERNPKHSGEEVWGSGLSLHRGPTAGGRMEHSGTQKHCRVAGEQQPSRLPSWALSCPRGWAWCCPPTPTPSEAPSCGPAPSGSLREFVNISRYHGILLTPNQILVFTFKTTGERHRRGPALTHSLVG